MRTLKINKNEGVSYAILRKVLKDGETMSKSDLENEFLKLDKDSRTELVKLSNKIDYTLKKPILEGTEFKIPGFKETEKNSDKIKLIVKEKEGLSHTVLRAKLGEQANSMSTSDLEKYFSSLDKEVKNNFLKNLKDLEKEIKGPLIAGTSFQVSLEKFDIGNIFPKKVEEKQTEQKSETKGENKDQKTEEHKEQGKIDDSKLLAKRNEVDKQVENVEKLETTLSNLQQTESKEQNPKENKTPEKIDENLKKGQERLAEFNKKNNLNVSVDFEKFPYRENQEGLNGNFTVIYGDYIFSGEFKNDKFEGKGIYTWANGDKYDGEFKNDIREGKGILTLANGAKYDGEYKNDKFEGKGILTLANGAKYDGEYKNDKFEGKGIYTWANGDKYEGEWKNDKREGKGIYTGADGSKYDGEWKNDKREGKGIYTGADGRKYDGEFKNDKAEGKGILTFADGDFKEGIFKEDKLYTGVFNINWQFDKYYVEGKEVSKSKYENYNKQ